ncbi:MAG: type II toxin-antitoxin system VapC family toxin [Terrimicrobiaceae bacterium]
MRRYLLDTHVLIWWSQNDPRLPHKWDQLFSHGPDEILFSIVSLWEISIRRSLSKLKIEGDLGDFSRTLESEHGFRRIGLEVSELCRLEKLPVAHTDLFDQLLIAQCIEHGATAITNHLKWLDYPVRRDF